jgi:hypothetical protein
LLLEWVAAAMCGDACGNCWLLVMESLLTAKVPVAVHVRVVGRCEHIAGGVRSVRVVQAMQAVA